MKNLPWFSLLPCALLTLACSTVTPPPPPDAPRITRFEASTTRIGAGQSVTLSFTTERAELLELNDDHGRTIQLAGDIGEGTAVVAPTSTTFYVLRASGPGGRASAFVQVAVNEPLRELFLLAVPPAIDSGQASQLLWGASGARAVTLETDGQPQTLTGTSGTISVQPARTTRYRLVATTTDGTMASTEAIVDVRPVLDTFTVTAPTRVEVGESLQLTWRSHGGLRVTVSERVFGTVFTSSELAFVDDGTATFVIPAQLPTGLPLTDGAVLEFTIRVEGAQSSVTGTGTALVGTQPVITALDFPTVVTAAGSFTVGWQTVGAEQVTISFAGRAVFATQPGELARVTRGSVVLPSPSAPGEYVFAAISQGVTNSVRTAVSLVAPPTIGTFTSTGAAANPGVAVPLSWTTTGAARLQLAVENGPTFKVITDAAMLAAGTADVRPLTDVTVTLEAYNAAGDVARASQPVPVTSGLVQVTPSPVLTQDLISLGWDFSVQGVTEVLGVGSDVGPGVANSTAFIDLSSVATARQLVFADPEDGVEPLARLEGFRFPLLGVPRDQFHVGVNGFLAFAAPADGMATHQSIGLTGNASPALVAPYWADLNLAPQSKVLWAIVPSQGERALVVQWDQVQLGADAASVLTFQVQLGESGRVRFVYGALTGASTALAQVTIGVRDARLGLSWSHDGAPATHVLAPQLELPFLAVQGPTGSFSVIAERYGPVHFLARSATGTFVASPVVRAFAAGDVSITEAMPLPAMGLTLGQWFELRNDTSHSVDVGGLLVRANGSVDGGVLGPAVLAPNARLLLGQSTDLVETGGAAVSHVCSDVVMLPAVDRLRLLVGGAQLAELAWRDLATVDSVMLDPGFRQLDAGVACARTDTFGLAGAHGSPGSPEPQCGPYLVSQIAPNFITPPTDAGVLSTLDADEGFATLALPSTFTYFGTDYDAVQVSQNGFLAFGPPLSNAYRNNVTGVSAVAPNGVVAPFWDDLQREVNGGLSMWRAIDRTIITWSGYRFSGAPVGSARLDVQVHLLDDDGVEFHYGKLQPGPYALPDTAARLSGRSATIGLERPDGRVLIPWSLNGPRTVSPAQSLRFTPN